MPKEPRPYVAKKYRCKCAEKRTAIHYPERRFSVMRMGWGQYFVNDAITNEGVVCNHWTKCLGEEIMERYRSGELKRRLFTVLHGQVHIYPKKS